MKIDLFRNPNCEFEIPNVDVVEDPAPGTMIFDLDEVKLHCRVDTDDEENALLGRITRAATGYVERICGLALLPRKLKMSFTRFPDHGELRLPVRPVRAIESITYVNPLDGTRATVPPADYRLISSRYNAIVVPAWEKWWPSARYDRLGIEVLFTTGYVDADVPESLDEVKSAILLLAGDLYENRESQGISTRIYSSMFDNRAFRRLLSGHRVRF